MINALATGLAAQLTLAAVAKVRDPGPGSHTLLATLWPRVPARVFAALDLAVSVLLVWPSATPIAAVVAAAAIGGSEVAVAVTRGRGVTSCGCLGPVPGGSPRRERAAKAIMMVEAGGAFAEVALAIPMPMILQVSVAAVATAAVLTLAPELAPGWPGRHPLTWGEALRELAQHPDYHRWRPHLLDSRPAEVRQVGRSWRIVLDAWSDERPVLLVAVVSRSGVRLQAHDALTMGLLH